MNGRSPELQAEAARALGVLLSQYPQYPAVALWRCWELALIRQFSLARPLLDLGCGNGSILDLLTGGGGLLKRTGPVIGIDIVEESARLAARLEVYERVFLADARALPFGPRRFETVVSVCVLEHIPAVETVLDSVFQVLRPGGRFIFSVPAPRLCDIARETHPRDADRFVARFNERVEHHNVWDAALWESRLRDAGLEVSEVLGFMPPDVARTWFQAYDWTVRPIRGRGALYRLAGPGLRRFGVASALRGYWLRRLVSAAREGVSCDVERASALLIVARRA